MAIVNSTLQGKKLLGLVALLFLALAYFLLPASKAEVFTKDDLLFISLKDGKLQGSNRPNGLMWVDEGKSLLVVLPGKNGEPKAIYLMDPETGETEKIVEGSRPILSPGGTKLAYTATDGSINVGTLSGSTFKQSTRLATRPEGGEKAGIYGDSISFAPDANRFAFIRFNAVAQEDGQPLSTATAPEVWVHDLDSGEAHRVFTPPTPQKLRSDSTRVNGLAIVNTQLSGLAYGRDGRIYFGQGFGVRRNGMDAHIYYIDEGAAPVMLAEDIRNNSWGLRLRLTADGRYLLSPYSPAPDFMNYTVIGAAAIFDTETGARTLFNLSTGVGTSPTWEPEGQMLIACKPPGAYRGVLCFGDVKTGEVAMTTLEPTADMYDQSVSPDGRRVAWVSLDRTGAKRIRVSGIDGRNAKTLWQDNPIDLARKELGETRLFRWNSFDGLEFEGVLILPVGYQEGTPVPLIVDIHGGPGGGVKLPGSLLNATPLEQQLWAGMGYAVFVTDYRKAQTAQNGLEAARRHPSMSFDEADAADVIAGIEHLIDLGIADPDRIAGIGHSAGATIINQLVTQSDILALAISKEGTYDYRSLVVEREDNPSLYDTALYSLRATPETLSEWAEKSSPIVYAGKIKTPFLLITAGNNTPDIIEFQRERSDAFVGAINDGGGVAESLFFPDDFHVISKEKNVREMLGTTIEWIDRYIGEAANVDESTQKVVNQ